MICSTFQESKAEMQKSVNQTTRLLSHEEGIEREEVDVSEKQSPLHVFFNIFKAVVGAGSFALPQGFQHGGIWGSLVGMVIIALMSDYTIKQMIRTKVFLNHTGSYPELVRDGLPQAWGVGVGRMLYGMIVVTVLGVCTVYLVFCGSLIDNFLQSTLNVHEQFVVGPIVAMGSFLAVVSWLPSLRKIAFLSLVGDVALLIAMIATMIYGTHFYDVEAIGTYPLWPTSGTDIVKFYGPVVFLFGIHMLVVPLHNEMANPKKFESTLDFSIVVVVLSNTAFAMFGFLLFNKHMSNPITESLSTTYLGLNVIADIALIFDLTFTFTVIFVAGRDVIEASFFGPDDMTNETYRKRCAIRTGLTLLCTFLAVVLHDDFGNLVNLISGTTMSTMCFVLPPLLFLTALWPSQHSRCNTSAEIAMSFAVCAVNVGIIIVGVGTACLLTYTAIDDILHA